MLVTMKASSNFCIVPGLTRTIGPAIRKLTTPCAAPAEAGLPLSFFSTRSTPKRVSQAVNKK